MAEELELLVASWICEGEMQSSGEVRRLVEKAMVGVAVWSMLLATVEGWVMSRCTRWFRCLSIYLSM